MGRVWVDRGLGMQKSGLHMPLLPLPKPQRLRSIQRPSRKLIHYETCADPELCAQPGVATWTDGSPLAGSWRLTLPSQVPLRRCVRDIRSSARYRRCPDLYWPVAALNFTISSAGTRPRSFTSMPCALAHSRTSVARVSHPPPPPGRQASVRAESSVDKSSHSRDGSRSTWIMIRPGVRTTWCSWRSSCADVDERRPEERMPERSCFRVLP